jgi:adenine-specific DNA glycosylase
VRRVAVVVASKRAVVLARRRRDVLFGGLWEPPNAPNTRGGLEALVAALGLDAAEGQLEVVGEVTHVLSHRRLRVEVVRAALGSRRRFAVPGPEYDAVARVVLGKLAERPHASLSRRILEVANVGSRSLL